MTKRYFPVLLLLVASGCASAQGASAFVQGVGIRVGFDTGENVVIPNAPFQADVVITLTQTLADGNVLERETRGKAERDSAGRFRWQGAVTMSGGQAEAQGRSESIILDPVARQTLEWSSLFKNLHVSPLREGSHVGVEYTSYADGREYGPSVVPDHVTTKDLGTKNISGLTCTGTLVTTILPVGTIGNEKPIVITDETWRSAELQIVVERIVKDPLIGTRRVEFQNITRREPTVSAFQPPDGYTLRKSPLFSIPFRGTPPPAPGYSVTPNQAGR